MPFLYKLGSGISSLSSGSTDKQKNRAAGSPASNAETNMQEKPGLTDQEKARICVQIHIMYQFSWERPMQNLPRKKMNQGEDGNIKDEEM